MSTTSQLQLVLDRIDADFDNSLERLFALLRIKSISADPAFADDCKKAADHLAKDITTIGLSTEVRPTASHPAILGKKQWQRRLAPACAVLRALRRAAGRSARSLAPAALRTRGHQSRRRAKDHRRVRRRGRQGPAHNLCRILPRLETGDWIAAGRHHRPGRGRGIFSKNFVPFLEINKRELVADFALVCDTGMLDPNTPAITTSLRGLVYDEVKIKAANRDLHSGVFGGGAQNPNRVLTRILGGLFDDNGHITIPGFYDGAKDLPPDILAQWKKLNLTPKTFLKPIGLSIPAGEKDRLLSSRFPRARPATSTASSAAISARAQKP